MPSHKCFAILFVHFAAMAYYFKSKSYGLFLAFLEIIAVIKDNYLKEVIFYIENGSLTRVANNTGTLNNVEHNSLI